MITADTKTSEIRPGGRSFVTTIPMAVVREHDLRLRDALFWVSEPDGIKLKILKRTMVAEVLAEAEPEPTE
jgi:hypothetical protein